ncbi:MAG: DJ-1/PfpI family protein [Epulopiscium sp.]|nr:DJ-1/PfpI family protein [Candidatus Epulonipiscium sp.]
MKQAHVYLADGFEEVEALTVVDILRRAGVEVITVSMMDALTVKGTHDIMIQADKQFHEVAQQEVDLLVLPGGMPGTTYLEKHKGLEQKLKRAMDKNLYIGAICAAPSILGKLNFLVNKKATCYPGFESSLQGAQVVTQSVVQDGNIITSRGVGTALDFSLQLVKILISAEKMKELKEEIIAI